MNLSRYLRKMRGSTHGSPLRVNSSEVIWSWIGGFLGIALLAWFNHSFFTGTDLTLMIASFGASAVLVYDAVRSPVAQPNNLVGGHIISAMVGVTIWKLCQHTPLLAEALAVATAIAAMYLTRTLHPPGGATALVAVIGSDRIHDLGYLFVLIPATVGPLLLLLVALVTNNVPRTRRYPEIWF